MIFITYNNNVHMLYDHDARKYSARVKPIKNVTSSSSPGQILYFISTVIL